VSSRRSFENRNFKLFDKLGRGSFFARTTFILLGLGLLPTHETICVAQSEKRDIEIEFSFETHRYAKSSFHLKIIDRIMFVNGIELFPEEIILKKRFLTQALTIKEHPDSIRSCEAGTWVHQVSKNGVKREEQGCMEDERFKDLQKVFHDLQS